MNFNILSKLSFIVHYKKESTSKSIANILKEDIAESIKYIYTDDDLLYNKLSKLENEHDVDSAPPILTKQDNLSIPRYSLKKELRSGINWPEVFDIAEDMGYVAYSTPRGKKDNFRLNKFGIGSSVLDLILSNYSDSCNYDVFFSPVFPLLSLDSRFISASRTMFNSDTLLVTLNAVARKHFNLIVKLVQQFKSKPLSQRFDSIKVTMLENGVSQFETYIIQKCFIESFLNGILKEDDYDVTTEYKVLDLMFKLHCTDGSKYLLEWFSPLKP